MHGARAVQVPCPAVIVRDVSCSSRIQSRGSVMPFEGNGSSWTIGAVVTKLIRVLE